MHIEFLYHHTTLLILQYIYSDVYSSVLDVVMVVLDYGLCDTMCFSRRTPGLSRNPHSGKEYLPWRTLLYSFGKSIKPSPPLFYSQCIYERHAVFVQRAFSTIHPCHISKTKITKHL